LTRFVTPYSQGVQHSELPAAWAMDNAAGLSAIDKEVTRQALLLAYVHDFQILALFSAICVLLVFLMRPARIGPR
jgi:DHA2 family multidrug resistance protein